MASNAYSYTINNPGTTDALNPLIRANDRIGISVFNDGTDAADFISVFLGPRPDVEHFIAVILPYSLWEPPAGICCSDPLWLVWRTNNGASRAYVTEYMRIA